MLQLPKNLHLQLTESGKHKVVLEETLKCQKHFDQYIVLNNYALICENTCIIACYLTVSSSFFAALLFLMSKIKVKEFGTHFILPLEKI